MHFSLNLETVIGRTYTSLRTIYEGRVPKIRHCSPSVPMRESVLQNLQITHEQIQTLYNNISTHLYTEIKHSH